ncbi:7-methylguanosine phosphate-specific 5'-nucleotidase-like isoform X2 [Belonocnema kinseyi]|uniref:7-methylguanosine phosphate-specific 5'-nucleotidase-like isoform X2 n=1 Tax=Belonocnema kinseyi TaxID=2817044 RepID=UPI00143CFB0F|nr:7-methylguanosine phosphate-specific 5'-nucleotidase-like isoform X2 [Belonocnema kinseyi]
MPNKITFADFPILSRSGVKIKDKDEVIRKLNNIIRGGPEKLQVVTDFDLTLTKQHVNGKNHLSSFDIFAKCKQLPPTYEENSIQLAKRYVKIEKDPEIPLEVKINAMEEWMELGEQNIKGYEFDPTELEEVAEKYGTDLRDGTKILMDKLNAANLPVLVFSAGLGDVVHAILKHNSVLHPNVEIVSNFLKYSGKMLDGIRGKKIHVFTKNETNLDPEHLKRLESRKNILLMGDSLGDTTMTNGIQNIENIFKIGFLYSKDDEIVRKSLDAYMNLFDVVLIDDQTMDLPLFILEMIV